MNETAQCRILRVIQVCVVNKMGERNIFEQIGEVEAGGRML